jgi:RNA polymerase sigma factor (sigma-70 family)
MNRYAYILEKCRESDFHRLRTFNSAAGASFSTWLTVIARRLCLDYERTRYGRHSAGATADVNSNRVVRRTLVDSIALELDIDLIEAPATDSQETAVVRAERTATLREAVSGLTSRERLLLALRFEDDLTAGRIATMLGLPTPFHVYRQLNAVLARLRAALISRGIDGPGD